MKKLFLSILFFSSIIFAQANYVDVDHPVYLFLERMETQQLINNYNSFDLPLTRNDIAGFIHQVLNNKNDLNEVDKNILNDLKSEFEFELYGTTENFQSIIGKGSYNPLNQKEKYFYYHNDPGKFNVFFNIIGETQYINNNLPELDINYNAAIFKGGGLIRGRLLDKFGFSIKATNGQAFGDKQAAFVRDDIKYNFKFSEREEEKFFDQTEGYFAADFDLVQFKIGRDRANIGYGDLKSILGSTSPKFDYLSLSFKYKFLSFNYLHGKLLGNETIEADSIFGNVSSIDEKYVVYHRFGFNLSKHFDFGLGEMIIYGDRPFDLSYFNPFNFYKSIEHANQDRDNSLLFIDANNNSIKGLKFHSTLIIDDLKFKQLGSGWWGNKFLFHAGIFSSLLYDYLPIDFSLDYYRVDPYTLTHRLSRNNYTNFGYNLTSQLKPNSETFYTAFDYGITNRFKITTSFRYTIHGSNPVQNDGTIRNVGGNILLGHRTFDSETVNFLDGDLEFSREFSVSLSYEPFNQIYFLFILNYLNESLQNSINRKELNSIITLSASL